jgi:hypothetical protein
LFHLLGLGIAIEVADEAGPVFGGPLTEVVDKGLYKRPAGSAQGLGTTEVSGVAFDQSRVKLMLADQLAETIPKSWLAVVGGRTVAGRYSTSLPLFSFRRPKGSEFLDRTQTNPIGLAQGSVDGPSLGHPHLGPTDKSRDIGRVRVPVAHEALRVRRLVDRGSEDPAVGGGIAELTKRLSSDTRAAMTAGEPKQAGMGYVPPSVKTAQFAQGDRKTVVDCQGTQGLEIPLAQVLAPPSACKSKVLSEKVLSHCLFSLSRCKKSLG